MSLGSALAAERIKMRKTLFFRLPLYFTLVTGILPASFFFPFKMKSGGQGLNAAVMADSTISIWGRMLLPVFAVMISLAAYQNEHTLAMWKHLSALPTRGRSQVLAKHTLLAVNVAFATFWLGVVAVVGSYALHAYRPELVFRMNWPRLSIGLLLMLLEGLGVTATIAVIAARVRTGYVGATLGVAALGCVFGNALTMHDYVPWGFGETWSRVISPPNEGGGAYSLTTACISTVVWVAACIFVHLGMEKRRPHY